jgi:hypothetical protein
MPEGFAPWSLLGLSTHVAGAIAAATVALWVAGRRSRFGAAGMPVVVGLCLITLWSLVIAGGGRPILATVTEMARNLAWLLVVYRLFAGDGRDRSLAPIRPLVIALVLSNCSI